MSAQIAVAMRSTFSDSLRSPNFTASRPCRRALPLDRDLPSRVRGPVLFLAFLRLAASVFAEVIGTAQAFDVLVHLVFEERKAAAGSVLV